MNKPEIKQDLNKIIETIFALEEKLPYYGICGGSEKEPNILTELRNKLYKTRGEIINIGNFVKLLDTNEIDDILKNKTGY